jgi:hypothetical protein
MPQVPRTWGTPWGWAAALAALGGALCCVGWCRTRHWVKHYARLVGVSCCVEWCIMLQGAPGSLNLASGLRGAPGSLNLGSGLWAPGCPRFFEPGLRTPGCPRFFEPGLRTPGCPRFFEPGRILDAQGALGYSILASMLTCGLGRTRCMTLDQSVAGFSDTKRCPLVSIATTSPATSIS